MEHVEHSVGVLLQPPQSALNVCANKEFVYAWTKFWLPFYSSALTYYDTSEY